MASSDVDQKFLGKWAKLTADSNALLSSSLYQLLGLSVRLARKVVKARRHRKLDTSRDTKSMSLYHHIIWLSREGLSIVEIFVLPYTQEGQHGPECQVLAAKLRASFFHIFCLFHNKPPVSQLTANSASNSPNTGRTRPGATLRDPINSITSETSFLTNPFASGGPVLTPPPPPGLPMPVSTPHASAFLLPPLNFIPPTTAHFNTVSTLAQTLLPGSHPLRLSVALEHCAFLWDCLHERESSRKTARAAIRDVYRSQEGMDDREFEEAAELVAVLGKMMKRKSWEGT
ncbi:14-3-3 protein, partial [Patellaria atrata CBS 101060]